MKKKALKKEEEINQILIPKLIYSIMGFQVRYIIDKNYLL